MVSKPITNEDPKMGKETRDFPSEEYGGPRGSLEKKICKRTMKSTTSPYDPFPAFYPLE